MPLLHCSSGQVPCGSRRHPPARARGIHRGALRIDRHDQSGLGPGLQRVAQHGFLAQRELLGGVHYGLQALEPIADRRLVRLPLALQVVQPVVVAFPAGRQG